MFFKRFKIFFDGLIFIIFLIPLLLILSSWILFSCEPQRSIPEITLDNPLIVGDRPPVVVAHRGGAGEYPEETLLSFNHSSRLGVDYLEMDVRLTADNQLVLHHDRLIERTSDGLGAVINLKLENLKKYNFAYNFTNKEGVFFYRTTGKSQKISTIDELFTQFPNYKVMIEIKDNNTEGEVAADLLYKSIVKYNKQDNVIIASFYDDIVSFFRQQSDGMIITAAAQKETIWFYLSYLTGIDFLYEKKSDLLIIPFSIFGIDLNKKEIIAYAHRLNLAVYYWTINDVNTMESLIKNGADGIITDYPTRLLEVIDGLSSDENQ